jgi:hypothetical protein
MKSILNDINRLEKAYDFLLCLNNAYKEFHLFPSDETETNLFNIHIKANAFLEKYGNDQ